MNRMDCGEARDLLHAYEDDELSAAERAAVAGHVKDCADCSTAHRELNSLRRLVRAAGTFEMPQRLEASVRHAIGMESRRWLDGRGRRYAALAASHATIAILVATLVYWTALHTDERAAIARDVVSAHVRSLLGERLVQVASSDTHAVRPWFAGKVPFAPNVVDLADRGFPLLGGRVDFVLDQPVAALVYERRRHRINVFIVPQAKVAATGSFGANYNGYNVLAWRERGFAYFSVSELNAAELQELADALTAAPAAQ